MVGVVTCGGIVAYGDHGVLCRVRDRFRLTQALVVDPLYLQHSYSEKSIDYRVSA